MVDMTTKDMTYDIPNIGCLLGMAYQSEAARLSRALTYAGIDITAAEYLILRVLFSKGRLQQCEISQTLGKDKASVNRSVLSLTRKGFVATTSVSYKCCIVALTDGGEALRPRLLDIARQLQQDLSHRITNEQMSRLREILVKIIQ